MIMKNIIDYVKEYGQETCEKRPFCETDALVLSQFAYMRWGRVIPRLDRNKSGIQLKDMYKKVDAEHVYMHELNPEKNAALLEEMANSKRFGNMVCNYYSSQTNEGITMQFCAMTFFMKGALPVIVFRGTDRTVVGWKEDFNMAFSEPIPGQRMAALYVNEVAARIEGDFIVAGHSKGGNLAAFSAMAAMPEVKSRINTIYSFDGPGFRPDILEAYKYSEIADRVKKYMPHSSIVGILLEGSQDYITVRCEAIGGAFAHSPYRWIIENGRFVELQKLGKKSLVMHKSLNEWAYELDDHEKEVLVDNLFSILDAPDAGDFSSILDNWRSSAAKMKKTALEIDKDQWTIILRIIKELLKIIRKNILEG